MSKSAMKSAAKIIEAVPEGIIVYEPSTKRTLVVNREMESLISSYGSDRVEIPA